MERLGIPVGLIFELIELVVGSDDRVLPLVAAVPDRALQRQHRKIDSQIGDVEQFLARRRRDEETALSLRDRKTLERDARQRFAQRAQSDIVALAQRVGLQLVVGRECAADNVIMDSLIGLVRQRLRRIDLATGSRSPV
jgi:hypothetical protein